MPEQYRKNIRLIDILQDLLSRGLQSWIKEKPSESFEGIYGYLEHSIMELFKKASFNMTEGAKKWMAQQLYMSIRFSTSKIQTIETMNQRPPVVFPEVDIKTIPSDDLRMLGSLLSDCDFAPQIAAELHRRA